MWLCCADTPQRLPTYADDRFWYPLFLAGKSFRGVFAFTQTTTMLFNHVEEVAAAAS
jgi:hypothetical protein